MSSVPKTNFVTSALKEFTFSSMNCRGVQAGYVNEFIEELSGGCSYSVIALQELIFGIS